MFDDNTAIYLRDLSAQNPKLIFLTKTIIFGVGQIKKQRLRRNSYQPFTASIRKLEGKLSHGTVGERISSTLAGKKTGGRR